jgi:hypothetical protein
LFAGRLWRRYVPPRRLGWVLAWQIRNDVVDIFDEVDEELRAERAQQWLRRNGWMIVAAALLIVAGAGGWQAWRWWETKQDLAAAENFLGALRAAEAVAPTSLPEARVGAARGLEQVAASAPAGYRTLARLRAAALRAASGDRAGALGLLDAVAADGGADPVLRDYASLLWVQYQVDDGDAARLRARLAPLSGPENAWHALAREAEAMIALRLGLGEEARKILGPLAADATAPEGVRRRASLLLAQPGQ